MAEMVVTSRPTVKVTSRYLPWNGLTGLSTCRTKFGMCVPSKAKAKLGEVGEGGGKVIVASLVLLIGMALAAATMMKSK